MARKAKSMKAISFPVYVWLKTPNPYGNKVKVSGIEITTTKKIIEKPETLAKLKMIQTFLEVEPMYPAISVGQVEETPVEETPAETVETPKKKIQVKEDA